MKNGRHFLGVLIIYSLFSCQEYKPPEIETCIVDSTSLFCIDLRLEEEKQEYDKSFEESINYLCTSPADYGRLQNYCQDLRRDLIKCERN